MKFKQKNIVLGRVTIITAVFNCVQTLHACIESVLSQDYSDIEFIVMDGGSTDGSLEIIQSFGNRLIWRSEPDKGIYDAWNKSLALATGEWIAFLGGDDIYLPGAISSYMAISANDIDYISSRVRWVESSGRARIIGSAWSWPDFQKCMTTAHVGSFHHYTLYERYGVYNLDYRIVGDYELLLRAGNALRAKFLPRITTQMHAGGASDSHRALAEAAKAKVHSGKRSAPLAKFELIIAHVKFFARNLLSKIGVLNQS